jgi:serine/threonine-protein kinase NIM1
MQKLHHPNIIRLYEVIHTQERLFICMEYAPEGELYTKISSDGRINEAQGRAIFSQIISAVDHMHSNNIIHRDIKAENIFFSNLDPFIIKVGDLGFSTEATIDRQLNTYCGR